MRLYSFQYDLIKIKIKEQYFKTYICIFKIVCIICCAFQKGANYELSSRYW